MKLKPTIIILFLSALAIADWGPGGFWGSEAVPGTYSNENDTVIITRGSDTLPGDPFWYAEWPDRDPPEFMVLEQSGDLKLLAQFPADPPWGPWPNSTIISFGESGGENTGTDHASVDKSDENGDVDVKSSKFLERH